MILMMNTIITIDNNNRGITNITVEQKHKKSYSLHTT